ncbi:MAG: single-stranded-DNA-specific exonuclease RecJ [Treponema sp.]|jgi:single-stranded-DNA-specific exonuclease|nr:single-stranded-DNA-specific exonuclease RecJ [Treponema sp.]
MVWNKTEIPAAQVKELAAKYGCDLLTASILIRRGLSSGGEIRYFLEDDLRHLHNPFALPGMEDAVERIIAAKEEGEKVLVFGDRDADGITSTALLAGFLQDIGMDVIWRLPAGDDRYGLSIEAVEEFAKAYGSLIITVDCGISNNDEVKRANELSIDVIVTDHHNPQENLPEAYCIVNPKLHESKYPFKYLAGCGVAYKLVQALRFALKSETYNQPVCLLNCRPLNDAWIIEIAKIRNLTVIDTLAETIALDNKGQSLVGIGDTRLPSFLQSQQILVWDAPLQKKILAKLFGKGVEIGMLDIAPEIGRVIPSARGKSLIRIKELSTIAKYCEGEGGELEVFVNLFISFIQRRENHFSEENNGDLQLACLGTIADIMPLKDENRVIVRRGIRAMSEKPLPSLANLLSLLKLTGAGKRLQAHEISWQLTPAINAAGRMGHPEKAVALFLEKDSVLRNKLADEVIAMNNDRKKAGYESWALAEPRARESLADFNGKLVLASGDDIPRGFTGIIANKLSAIFKVPAVVVSFAREGEASGSLRSPGNWDLADFLEPCADLFINWGGHKYAAGFSMDIKQKSDNWNIFIERLKNTINAPDNTFEAGNKEDKTVTQVDAELLPALLTPDILKTVDRFEPFGEENRPLVFMTKNLRIQALDLMGRPEAKHVRLTLDTGKHKWPAKYWNAVDKIKTEFDDGDNVDALYTLSRNWFKGVETPEMTIIDLKRCVK